MFLFNEDLFAGADNTLFRLMIGAGADAQFASVLLNMQDKVRHAVSALKLSLDDTTESDLPQFSDLLEDFNFGFYAPFSKLACQKAAKRFRVKAMDLTDCSEWMNLDIFIPVMQTALDICHLENVILLSQMPENANKSLMELNTMSINGLIEDAFSHATMGLSFLAARKSKGYDCSISKVEFHKSVISSLSGLSYRFRKHDKTTFELFSTLNELLNELAVNYSSLSNETKPVELMVCGDQKYNAAYSHMNDNTVIGSIDLPVDAFKLLPFANYNDEGDARQFCITKLSLPEGVDMPTVLEGIYYSLTSQCTCQHDCCGCVNEDFDATHINGEYVKITRNLVCNI
jgi:hypothetical protein